MPDIEIAAEELVIHRADVSHEHPPASSYVMEQNRGSLIGIASHFEPPKIDIAETTPTQFRVWERQWKNYRSLSGLEAQHHARQMQCLEMTFLNETLTTVDNLGMTDEERGNPEEVVRRMKNYVIGKVNIVMERYKLSLCCQKQGQSINDFLVELRQLASTCEFHDVRMNEDTIALRFISGLNDPGMRTRLLEMNTLDLKTLIGKAVSMESGKHCQRQFEESEKILAVKSSRGKDAQRKNSTKGGTNYAQSFECKRCGRSHAKNECPAKDAECKACHKKGHFMKMCRSKANAKSLSMNTITRRPMLNSMKECKGVDRKHWPQLDETVSKCCYVRVKFVAKNGIKKLYP